MATRRSASAQCTPGEYHIADTSRDGKIDAADRTILGYAEPKFFGGFSNALTAGPFSLDAFFNFSYGNDVANVSRVFTALAIESNVLGKQKQFANVPVIERAAAGRRAKAPLRAPSGARPETDHSFVFGS